MEKLSLVDQMWLVGSASHILGAHGGGSSNMLFAAENSSVIALFPEDLVKSHYYFLDESLGLAYAYSIGSKTDSANDFSIDIANLRDIFETLGLS